jgi:hypothetical protein
MRYRSKYQKINGVLGTVKETPGNCRIAVPFCTLHGQAAVKLPKDHILSSVITALRGPGPVEGQSKRCLRGQVNIATIVFWPASTSGGQSIKPPPGMFMEAPPHCVTSLQARPLARVHRGMHVDPETLADKGNLTFGRVGTFSCGWDM